MAHNFGEKTAYREVCNPLNVKQLEGKWGGERGEKDSRSKKSSQGPPLRQRWNTGARITKRKVRREGCSAMEKKKEIKRVLQQKRYVLQAGRIKRGAVRGGFDLRKEPGL